jgi:hypothetical protein
VSGVAQPSQELLAVFPSQPESPDIGHAETSHDIPNVREVLSGKLAFHHSRLCPSDKVGQRHVMAEIGRKLIGHGLSSNSAHGQLHLTVSKILRILVMDLDEVPSVVINLLIKSLGDLVGVNLLHVSGTPAVPANHIEPIPPATVGQRLPVGKLPLILLPGAQIASGQTL